ncbi:carbohydrate-binding protein [Hymenobacter sp. J193]|uniref:alpha-amylase family glycosyl hydrolase n=1 Tax=Hymenobacter sp. J193 TaxID=2898429 RepID=UPI0021510B25|nr:alpha-amylase family glycosyl hydrolase [Hymenobacter sp. J193]MCR5889175.1 carbohydrate-binding protein [Hymenobacter sp. J193]
MLVVIWMLLGIPLVTVQAADLTFNVNLQYRIQQGQFTAGTDQVVVRGSFSAGGVALTDPDGDKIYSGTVTGQTNDAQITYNYRITRGGVQTNESVAARKYVVQPTSAANVLSDWWNDQLPPYPYADFYVSSVKTIPGEIVRFFDSSEGGAATSWSWSMPGSTTPSSTAKNPTTTWTTPGTYTVSMTATGSGVSTTKTMRITVVSVDAQALGWWNEQVFYQIFPRSFLDTNGDGVGDLQGMINKLDYLSNELGVTALYIMPIYNAQQPWYGGYEVTNYKSVSAEFGGMAQFDAFVSAAQSRGMKVIMDMVFNHVSKSHPWYQSAGQGLGGQYDNYFLFRATNPGSAWRTNPVAHSNANFNFVWDKFTPGDIPDLNFYNASVRNTIKDVSTYWLNSRNTDGFRIDAPRYLYESGNALTDAEQQDLPATYAYWRSWRKHIKAANTRDAFSVGETWQTGNIPAMAKYVYQGFDIGFQFDIALGVEKSLNNENKNDLQYAVEQTNLYYPFLQYGVFTSNHDLAANGGAGPAAERRIKDRLTNNQDAKAKVAAAFVLTAPGVPFVYFGEEIGAGGNVSSRTPMRWNNTANAGFTTGTPWYAVGGDYPTYNVASQKADPNSIWNLYKKLIALRKAQPALRQGKYTTVSNSTSGVYTFVRTSGAETVFVVLNMSSTAQNNVALSVNLPNTVANSTYTVANLLGSSTAAPANATVSGNSISNWVPFASIPANGYYVLKLNGTVTPTAQAVPGKIEAESYSAMLNVDTEVTTDTGGGRNVDYFDTNDWVEYDVNVASAGSYNVDFRVASAVGNATLQLRNSAGTSLGSISVGNTGGWQSWTTVPMTVTLPAGIQKLRVHAVASTGCNLNWLTFTTAAGSTNRAPVANAGPDQNLGAGTTSATLTAAGSTDPDGNALTYSWTKVSGPAATFSSTTAVSPTVSGLTSGTYVLQVSVSDGALSATDQVQIVVQASSTATKYYIINRWQNTYLYDNAAQVRYAATASGTAYQWTLETVGSNTRIRNVASGNYMNIEGQTGAVQCTVVPDFYTSGQWVRETVSGTSYFRIRNVWQPGNYIHVENLNGSAQYGAVDASFYSGHWSFQPVAGARTALAAKGAAAAKTPLTLFPNPISQGRLTVLLPSRAATAQLRLLDSQGRTVLDRAAAVAGGQTSLDVTGLAKGLYLLQATTDGTTHTGRVVVE